MQLKQMLSRKASLDRMQDHFASKLKLAGDSALGSVSLLGEGIRENEKTIAASFPMVLKTKDGSSFLKAESKSKRKACTNFLLAGAKQAKAARSARSAARVGCTGHLTKQNKVSNTGSGIPLSQVVRLKYVKGFTQAVSTPCPMEDLV
jgi:hypothetical protein